MRFLIVIDMQNDFISGSLGSEQAKKIVGKVKQKIDNFNGKIIFTRDAHDKDYLCTQEGERLPIKHCIFKTYGWEICDELRSCVGCAKILDKPSFGTLDIGEMICASCENVDSIEEIQLVGLCTDICVVSNALILKAQFPEVSIVVDSNCCAGSNKHLHDCALEVMKSCQIDVL